MLVRLDCPGIFWCVRDIRKHEAVVVRSLVAISADTVTKLGHVRSLTHNPRTTLNIPRLDKMDMPPLFRCTTLDVQIMTVKVGKDKKVSVQPSHRLARNARIEHIHNKGYISSRLYRHLFLHLTLLRCYTTRFPKCNDRLHAHEEESHKRDKERR